MNMFSKSAAAAVAIAVLSGSALVSTTATSQAGGYGYNNHHGYNNHGYNNYGYKYSYNHYQPRCFWTKVKVHGYNGWHWEKVKVCN